MARYKSIPFAPELAIEVASPQQTADDMAAKAQRYLQGGTRLVWVVWPDNRRVEVWHIDVVGPAAALHGGDMLDGQGVVPVFPHPVFDIFDA